MGIERIHELMKRASSRRSVKQALGDLLMAKRYAEIVCASTAYSQADRREAIVYANVLEANLIDWASRSLQKWEINGVVQMHLPKEALVKKKKRAVQPSDDVEELFRDEFTPNLDVRVLNALYNCANRMQEDRKKGDAFPWHKDLPPPRTVGDLTKWSRSKLLFIKDFGEKSADFLEAAMKRAGYSLKE